jgi:CDP-diacylglycerol--glycerol-3-phosphate 3-phosphatidyltransferase
VTDVLDGIIARAWNLRTSFGSRLDSIADEMTYVAALVGAFQFEYQVLRPHTSLLYSFILLLVLATLIPLIKFRKIPSFHLYSFKANALFQAIFFFCLFVFDFYTYLYYPVFAFGILACFESIAITLLLDKPISDAKGIYWVLLKKRGCS